MTPRRHIGSWRTIARCVTLIAVLIGATGCGLSADDEPHAIAAEDLPADLLDPNPPTSTTLPGTTATAAVTVYLMVREGDTTHLSPVDREVAITGVVDASLQGDASRAADRINALLIPTSADEQGRGLISSIPTDTVLLDTNLVASDDELEVNLSGALFDVQGTELANAFAQLVWTVTELDGVRQVSFKVDGEAYRAPNAEGIEQDGAVTRADYSALAPPP
jgi:spore germination protein GerM